MKIRLIAIAYVFVAMIFSACAFAQYAPEVIKVTGDPKIMKKGSDKWVSCALKMTVDNGDRVMTAKDCSVEIGFVQDRKNVIRICPDSDATISSGNEPAYAVELAAGEIMALMPSLPEYSTFEIRTAAGVGGAKGTGWRVLTDGKVSTFEAYDNTIYTKGLNADGSLMYDETLVDMGYKTVIKKFEAPGPLQRLTPAEVDRWNAWRDEIKDREARASEVSDR